SRRTALESMNPITPSRKKRVSKGLEAPPTAQDKALSKEIQAQLKRLNKRIDVDFKAITEKIKDKKWYTPYSGAANLEQLAAKLKFKKQYPYYRLWSAKIHALDTDFLLGGSKEGHPIFRGIRDPRKIQDCAVLCSSMLLHCMFTMQQGYCPKIGKEFASWYGNNVKAKKDRLVNLELVISTTAPIMNP
ncbi:MAG: DUF5677 domain-containing protein, partial [Acidobacteria bacterium]|nr:DUF5677 domain-containing protein [Acidobacteriota bacterium]